VGVVIVCRGLGLGCGLGVGVGMLCEVELFDLL
jgi:hypothetical protein